MDKGGNSQDIQVTRDGCGCVIVNSGPQDARRTARQRCETHKGRSWRDAPGGWAHDTSCESEFVEGVYAWTACRCEERAKALQLTAQTHRAQADAVHAAHCCARHGCKYGTDNELCGVRAGRVEQVYPCEFCGMEDEEHKDCIPLNRQEREELEHLRHKIAELEETVFRLRMEVNRLRGLA
jgi:hypothetical protein